MQHWISSTGAKKVVVISGVARVARIWCQGARRSRRRRREHRGAKGADWVGHSVWGRRELPSGARGGAPAAIAFSAYFKPQNASSSGKFCCQSNVVLYEFQIPLWKSGGDSHHHYQKWWWQVTIVTYKVAPMISSSISSSCRFSFWHIGIATCSVSGYHCVTLDLTGLIVSRLRLFIFV